MQQNKMRLDLLEKKDLKWLYRRSVLSFWSVGICWLFAIFFAYIALYLYTRFEVNPYEFYWEYQLDFRYRVFTWAFAAAALYSMTMPYVARHIRNNAGRIYLLCRNILYIVILLLCILAAIFNSLANNSKFIYGCISFPAVCVIVFSLFPLYDKKLFGKNDFSHKQITAAWKKAKKMKSLKMRICP